MALESTTCGIVHHARRTRAHCPTMVSSFKLSSGTVCLLGWYSLVPSVPNSIYYSIWSYGVRLHNAVPTSADLLLVGTTNLIKYIYYLEPIVR